MSKYLCKLPVISSKRKCLWKETKYNEAQFIILHVYSQHYAQQIYPNYRPGDLIFKSDAKTNFSLLNSKFQIITLENVVPRIFWGYVLYV